MSFLKTLIPIAIDTAIVIAQELAKKSTKK